MAPELTRPARDNDAVSNYTKPERPPGVPAWAYVGAEYVNGTGQTLMWMCDIWCRDAGGTQECGNLKCDVRYMPWQEMAALGMWLIEQADIARDCQLREERPLGRMARRRPGRFRLTRPRPRRRTRTASRPAAWR